MSPQVVRLRPAPHTRTPIHSYSLRIAPAKHFLNWQQDPYGNFLARVVVPEQTNEFGVTVDLVADLEAFNPFDFFVEPYAEKFPFVYPEALRRELAPFLAVDTPSPRLDDLIEKIDRSSRRVVDFLVDTNRVVYKAVEYVIRLEPGVQTPDQTLTLGRGSCRDSSWLLVQLLRRLGIAARFVSGYLIQLVADEKPVDGPAGPDQDFTDLHAWCEAYVPGAGWIGLDPTSGLLAAEGHIPLACAPEHPSAAPIEGATEEVDTDFQFHMTVARVADVPRVTKPYTDEQWRSIVELGHRVDGDLSAKDVRLTMGGEPTFVSSLEPDAPEWNVAALGGRKLEIADRLMRRLHAKWQPKGLLFHGQGKWYPGEQLPRWALGCYFRRDGAPVWNDVDLVAKSGVRYGHTAADAERFARRVVRLLGLGESGLMPSHEDAWYYMWRERRLPANVDPLDAKLSDPMERDRLARVFRQGLEAVVGWVLPLSYDSGWFSTPWFLREERCFLLPGDSPMGFRLPLDSLPWAAPEDRVQGYPVDPFAPRAPLQQMFRLPPEGPGRAPAAKGPRDPRVSRTALCVEPRDGMLHVFMPPLFDLEAYLELVAAVERAARELGVPVQVEGYPPPDDPRLGLFRVTPDPGVIEVNVPPISSWSELIAQTENLYESAREEKLAAEKFEIDGAHIGSGGGNHMVLGGAASGDSPFLRRPDLLASLVAYWHNHPSLSYLFSGRFIGPTSQAPRVDEARNDSAYELEIAMKRLPKANEACPPWLVDRLFRNLLIDVTGNTHRTEFCIDKLYSPDGPGGRLGLVELRAFEMPPHWRMSSAQQLLLRAMVARFWAEPYTTPLVKWGTVLHDRFLLPYFVGQDFHDVLADMRGAGYDFVDDWFRPHQEFRFPFYGRVAKGAVTLELRGALEPWHVLGEETTAGGQARYVDSSLERVEVRAFGTTEGRHVVTCNGWALPMHPTGVETESVCGVRYRAWQPPSCLHPTVGVHGPLHFDVYDTWNRRAIFGCTYHVVHPGGRAVDDRPVNAAAAESRRIARFDRMGHVPGTFSVAEPDIDPHFPMTLDLRRLIT
jgi:uncharacterized protein (DUF2126 family)/transglutaminase-like putative cysteine protease